MDERLVAPTPEELATARQAGEERFVGRLIEMIGTGKLLASQAGRVYLAYARAGCFDETRKGDQDHGE